MMTPDETNAALTALLADANARACCSCGKAAAVRTRVPESALNQPPYRRAMNNAEMYVWLCFECGHEEQEVQ